MNNDSERQGAFAPYKIDQEESAEDTGYEFHDTEDGRCEELFGLPSGTEEGEELRGVNCDALSAGPFLF